MNLVYRFGCYKTYVFQEKIQKYKNVRKKYIFTWAIIYNYILKVKAIN